MNSTWLHHPATAALTLFVVALALHAGDVFTACPAGAPQQFPSARPTRIDALCGVAGATPTGEMTAENTVKNNFCAAGRPRPVTIADLIKLQFSSPTTGTRGHPLKDRAVLLRMGEGSHARLQGYVLVARQEGPETVNCGREVPNEPEYHDIHISIVNSPENDECSGVVVEMSPHHRPEAWNVALLRKVATNHLPVRVTGQLFFDSVHAPCVKGAPRIPSPPRASVWEIHPVYTFEVCTAKVCDAGGWLPLEKYGAQ